MKATLSKGTRDFLPIEVKRRKYIFDTIRKTFERYGYDEIETPAIEALQTLTGKYGDEGDRLLFKILNNGDYLKKADEQALDNRDSDALTPSISKRGLRYDLTVPFSRYVVMNQHELELPFKRYQIQPVWRGDRPQKGRYQEFYQCDADIVGSDSLLNEAEFCLIYDEVFTFLNLDVDIRINNRKILSGIAEIIDAEDKFSDLTTAIDKLDKVGKEGVLKIMKKMAFSEEQINSISEILEIGTIEEVEELLQESETGLKGIEEIKKVFRFLEGQEIQQNLIFDITLARGLDYYTGTIFEVVEDNTDLGSIGGGGRYDDLTAVFGMKNVSGVGISFGAERIYDILLELDLFPDTLENSLDALFVTFDEESLLYGFNALQELRDDGFRVDIYPEPENVGKQLKYADKRDISQVVLIGSNEMKSDKYLLKNMKTGDETMLSMAELKETLHKN